LLSLLDVRLGELPALQLEVGAGLDVDVVLEGS